MFVFVVDFGYEVFVYKGECILVFGIGEFVWELFLFVEWFEVVGVQVFYGLIICFFVVVGYVIEFVIFFMDNYGLGIFNFVYNVVYQQFDCIFVCIEIFVESIDMQFFKVLVEVVFVVEIVIYE